MTTVKRATHSSGHLSAAGEAEALLQDPDPDASPTVAKKPCADDPDENSDHRHGEAERHATELEHDADDEEQPSAEQRY